MRIEAVDAFSLVRTGPMQGGFLEVTVRARLSAGEYLALGHLDHDPYTTDHPLELWPDGPMLMCATRLEGPDRPDLILTNTPLLYEVRMLTRRLDPTEEEIRDLFASAVAAALQASGLEDQP